MTLSDDDKKLILSQMQGIVVTDFFKKEFVKHHLKLRVDVLDKKKKLIEKGEHPKLTN